MRKPDPIRKVICVDAPDRVDVDPQAHAFLTGLHRAHPAFNHGWADHLLHRRRWPNHRMDFADHSTAYGPHDQDEHETEREAFCIPQAKENSPANGSRQRKKNEQRGLVRDGKIDNRTDAKTERKVERAVQDEV
ncbi:MAG: hypothetical protein MK186_12960 [Henriciella sp.]|nr:hypothetical protein [Henriciella sp.]